MDMTEILNNINLIIMENDYTIISQRDYVIDTLKKNNFYVEYSQNGPGINSKHICWDIFYQVWRRNTI